MSTVDRSDRWLLCRAVCQAPRLRLFCVPFAGSGASLFNSWHYAFPDSVEVHSVQLPGRESRYNEPPLSDAYEAAKLLADAIEPYLERCYAFFGYSMGALLAFETIRELRRRNAPMPAQFFIAARCAPQLLSAGAVHPGSRRHRLLQLLSDYDSLLAPWQEAHLLEIILPVLQADVMLCEGYLYRAELPFGFPIQAFAGRSDRHAPLSCVQAWRQQTTGQFALEVYDGAHFFIKLYTAQLQRVIASRLEYLTRREVL